jgi:hypothetical protein
VNPEKITNASFTQALTFMKWLVSDTGQQIISDYGKSEYSQSLFFGAVQPLKTGSPQPDVSWIQQYAYFNGTECPTQYRYNAGDLYS